MNEGIKELAEQAQQYAEYVTPQGCEWLDTFKEKFAELIVRECLQVINQPNGVGDGDVIRISDDVKQHFGVEE